jgi:hypothetical protein
MDDSKEIIIGMPKRRGGAPSDFIRWPLNVRDVTSNKVHNDIRTQ